MCVWVCVVCVCVVTRDLSWGLLEVVEALESLLEWEEWVGVGGKSNRFITRGDGGSCKESRCMREIREENQLSGFHL